MSFQRYGILTVALAVFAGCNDDAVEPTVADLQVAVVTSGDGTDSDGYLLSLDGGGTVAAAINGTTTFDDVSIGSHSVTISGVDQPCTVQGDATVSVSVVAESQTTVTFTVSCPAA